jgi:hypothetical protein
MADNGSDSAPNSDTNASARRFSQKRKDALKAAGSSLSQSGQDEMDRASSMTIAPVQFRKGGKVRKAKHRVKPRA